VKLAQNFFDFYDAFAIMRS